MVGRFAAGVRFPVRTTINSDPLPSGRSILQETSMKQIFVFMRAALVLGLLGQLAPGSNLLRAQGADGRKLAGQAKEILEKNCVRCHGTSKAAGLDVRDYKLM